MLLFFWYSSYIKLNVEIVSDVIKKIGFDMKLKHTKLNNYYKLNFLELL